MRKIHHYKSSVKWTGNSGKGTINYKSYERNYSVNIDGKPEILGSSDPAFLGDKINTILKIYYLPPFLLAICCGTM
jgi:hypothetical protein